MSACFTRTCQAITHTHHILPLSCHMSIAYSHTHWSYARWWAAAGSVGAASHKVAHQVAHAPCRLPTFIARGLACLRPSACVHDVLAAVAMLSRRSLQAHLSIHCCHMHSYSVARQVMLTQVPLAIFSLMVRHALSFRLSGSSNPSMALSGRLVVPVGRRDGEDEHDAPRGPDHRLAAEVEEDLDGRVLQQRRQPVAASTWRLRMVSWRGEQRAG